MGKDRIVEDFSLPMDILGFNGRYFAGNEYLSLKSDDNGDFNKKNIIEINTETEALHKDWFDGPLVFMQLQYLITNNQEDQGQKMIELFLEKGSFFGVVAPQEFIDERQNIMDFFDDADAKEVFEKLINGIDRVSIEEGRITFKGRPPSGDYDF